MFLCCDWKKQLPCFNSFFFFVGQIKLGWISGRENFHCRQVKSQNFKQLKPFNQQHLGLIASITTYLIIHKQVTFQLIYKG